MIGVLIVDDHQVVRQGLRFLLEQEDGIQVVGEAADGSGAIQAVRTLAPTVVLLDLFLPGQDGISVLAQIKQDRPATEVLMLTSSHEDQHLLAAIRAGALAYLPKTAGVDQVVTAVRAAARGESVLEPRIAARLVREVRQATVRRRPLDQLSPRELEVLAALAHGRTNRQVARTLWDQRGDRQGPCVQHPGQAAARRPHPGGHLRPPATPGPPRPGTRRIDNKSRRAPRGNRRARMSRTT